MDMELENLRKENKILLDRLHEIEERYKMAIEISGDGVWDWNLQTNEVLYSSKWKNIIGFADNEVSNTFEQWERRIHPDDKERCMKKINEYLNQHILYYENEHRLLCRDGSYKWLLAKGKIIEWTEDGRPLRMIGTNIDISNLKEMEQAANESNKRFRNIFEQSPIGKVLFDRSGNLISINRAALNIFGLANEEDIRGFNLFLGPNITEDNKNILRNGHSIRLESDFKFELIKDRKLYNTTKSGIYIFDWILTPFLDEEGKVTGYMEQIQDITERRVAERALEYNEQKIRILLNSIDAQVFTFDSELRITGAYGRWFERNNIDTNIFLNKVLYDFFDEEGIQEVNEICSMAFLGKNVEYNFDRIFKNKKNYYQSLLTPIYNHNGKVEEVVAISVDITRLAEAREEIRRAKEAAEEANKAKSQFLANMSHEIRTPMNGIKGMADLLHLSGLTDEQMEMVSIIRSSSEALLQIINDILDLSKIDAGKVEINPEKVNITDFVDERAKLFGAAAENKGLTLTVNIENDVPEEILADRTRLTQIAGNLIGNAIKFTEKGGIGISVKKVKEIDSKVKLMFSIKDTGIGIKEEDIPRLFNYFTQLDDTFTKKFNGTGLGLAISKRLVELMGGEIFVESEYGIGSTFYFTCLVDIPQDNEKIRIIQTSDEIPESTSKLNMLYVEDDFVSRLIVEQVCKMKGWGVTTAINGREALHEYENNHFDLILMDIQMPEMSGIDVTRVIREREKIKGGHTPIIAITAYAMRSDREKCLNAGMDDYISKPIDIKSLCEIIEMWSTANKAK